MSQAGETRLRTVVPDDPTFSLQCLCADEHAYVLRPGSTARAGMLSTCAFHAQAETPKSKPSQSAPAAKPRRTSKPAKADDALTDSAKKAVAAVETVVAKLPSDEDLIESGKVTKMQEGAAWGAGGSEKEPPNHGSVDYPRGHPDCLCKYTIVISGVLESMLRQDAMDFVKRHGGRVTSAVSSKTSFLLCGMRSISTPQLPSIKFCRGGV